MDLRQMEYFVALAEESQFTRAAEITRVSQSGLSAAIKSLEEDLNAKLFTRTTRRVELTPAGRALFPHARNLLAEATAGRDAVTATVGRSPGHCASAPNSALVRSTCPNSSSDSTAGTAKWRSRSRRRGPAIC